MSKLRQVISMIAAAFLSLLLTACAVTPAEIKSETEKTVQASTQKIQDSKIQQVQERRMTLVDGNFIGDVPIDIPYASSLPEVFFKPLVIRSRGASFGTVSDAVKNLNLATGIPVVINPDVEDKNSQSSGNGASKTGGLDASGSAQARHVLDAPVSHTDPVRMSYRGTILGYVKEISSSGGVQWEYRGGALHFFRRVTRTFSLNNASPGAISMSDSMSKGSEAATGQTGTGTSGSTGSFSSSSRVAFQGNYSVWKSLLPALESVLTPSGKLSINEATATVVVTDTKDAVAKIAQIIDTENAILGKQVLVEVRVLRVDLNRQTQAGINLKSVYNVMRGDVALRGLNSSSQATQVSGSSGSVTFSILNPVSSLAGTSLAVQTLNQFGTVASDSTYSLITTNRVPAMTGSFNTRGFLAQTTPAAGGSDGGSGVPGLSPGSTTTGSFLRVLPTIKENNSVLVSMSMDISALLGLGSASTGSGETLQQIQWANTSGTKTISNLLVNQDESMVMAGIGDDSLSSITDNGVSGASSSSQKVKSLFVVIVTPRILKSL